MIVLLPGLGLNHRLFAAQQAALPNVIVPPWPDLDSTESLPAFARRVAEAIPKSESLYLGGSSFGGMVALEVAALLRPNAVLLIGSCRSPDAIVPLVRSLGSLVPAIPIPMFYPRRWLLGLIALSLERLSPEQRALFWSMTSTDFPAFLKWGIQAIRSWRPTPVSAPVLHIHGSDDRLIPVRYVAPDRVVPGGRHLLSLTHSQEVNAFPLEAVRGSAAA